PRQEVTVGYPKAKVDLVMNTTSLGLKSEDPLPFDPKQFSLSHARAVFDMVYLPVETPLLRAAKGAGCRTADGLGMLLYQGGRAWSCRRRIVRTAIMPSRGISTCLWSPGGCWVDDARTAARGSRFDIFWSSCCPPLCSWVAGWRLGGRRRRWRWFIACSSPGS